MEPLSRFEELRLFPDDLQIKDSHAGSYRVATFRHCPGTRNIAVIAPPCLMRGVTAFFSRLLQSEAGVAPSQATVPDKGRDHDSEPTTGGVLQAGHDKVCHPEKNAATPSKTCIVSLIMFCYRLTSRQVPIRSWIDPAFRPHWRRGLRQNRRRPGAGRNGQPRPICVACCGEKYARPRRYAVATCMRWTRCMGARAACACRLRRLPRRRNGMLTPTGTALMLQLPRVRLPSTVAAVRGHDARAKAATADSGALPRHASVAPTAASIPAEAPLIAVSRDRVENPINCLTSRHIMATASIAQRGLTLCAQADSPLARMPIEHDRQACTDAVIARLHSTPVILLDGNVFKLCIPVAHLS